MSQSAIAPPGPRTAERITRCAQELAEERGLDGFTMDELASRVGVSRRTLFNHVEGKLDAVLGAPPAPDPGLLVEFRAGGPTGRLPDDVRTVFTEVLRGQQRPTDELERVRRLMAEDPRLKRAMRDKFARFAEAFAEALLAREGDSFDPFRARAAAAVPLSLFGIAFEAFVADPSISLDDHYGSAFDGAAALFRADRDELPT